MHSYLVVGVLFVVALMALTSVSGGCATRSAISPADMQSIREAADLIRSCQLENGLIAQTPGENVRAIPYFSNLACLGLLRAYEITGDKRDLQSVLHYADWYAKNINPDGTVYDFEGTRANPVPTMKYDSSDSYPATFIVLCYEIYKVTGDLKWLKSKYPAIAHSMDGIKLTWQEDGLTFAKPDYKIKYLMDNLEVRIGLRAAVKVAGVLKDSAKGKAWKALVEENRKGLSGLWMPKEGTMAMAKFEDGNLHRMFAAWYPDGMANAMALAYILDPKDPKAAEIGRLVKDRFEGADDYWRFIALWKFGYKKEASAIRAKMATTVTESVDKGSLIRAFVPEKDDFFYRTDRLLLPDLKQVK